MPGKLFGCTNPNELIFTIETQEGSGILEGDTGVASIGDATLTHIQNLGGMDRMAYDEFICMQDGNLFRILENRRWNDPDEFNLRNKSEMAMFLKKNNVPEEWHERYQDAVEQELERQDSEDVLDRKDHLVPYDEWERFPNQWQRWDIPATPRNTVQYAGNSRKPFWDDIPENHPLASILIRVVTTLDYFEWHSIVTSKDIIQHNRVHTNNKIKRTEDGALYSYVDQKANVYLHVDTYVESMRRMIFSQKVDYKYKQFAYDRLHDAIFDIAYARGIPVDIMKEAIGKIEDQWTEDYINASRKRTKLEDPLYSYLVATSNRMIKLAHRGEEVYNELKKLGRKLFLSGFVCKKYTRGDDQSRGKYTSEIIVQRMRRHHWQKYRQTKTKIEEIRNNKKHKLSATAEVCVSRIDVVAEEAANSRDLQHFTKIANILIHRQEHLNMSEKDWDSVWEHYNDKKGWVINRLSNKAPQSEYKQRGYQGFGLSRLSS